MVHQVEAETADLGMNGGAGRIPSGFCTLTCAVYKWAQLHETVLRSYPSGPSDNPSYREYYTQWKAQPPGSAREEAMRKAYYELAVHNPGAVAWYCALKLEVADLYIEKAWENHNEFKSRGETVSAERFECVLVSKEPVQYMLATVPTPAFDANSIATIV